MIRFASLALLFAWLVSAQTKIDYNTQIKNTPMVSVLQYGCKGDGVTNDSTCFQNALNAGAAVVDGGGRTYLVSNLQVSSNTALQNFSLKVIGGNSYPISGLTVDGYTAPKSNITIRNVSIDGNRVNMFGFDASTAGPKTSPVAFIGNDGDKSCFRILGTVSNVLIDHVTGSFCGTDGLQLWSYALPGNDADSALRFHHIVVKDSVFKFNRRQGISLDSAFDVTIANVTAEYNGLDMAEVQTLYAAAPNMNDFTDWQPGTYTPGATCAGWAGSILHGDCGGQTLAGKKYADGIDVEGYGVGSAVHSISIHGGTYLNNANGGIQFIDTTSPALANFQPRQGIRVIGVLADQGIDHNQNIPWNYAINFDGPAGEFSDVTIADNVCLGIVSVFGGNAVSVVGNRINDMGLFTYAIYTGSTTNLEVLGNETDGKGVRFFDALGSVNQESLLRLPTTASYGAPLNYALMLGNQAVNPLAIGGGFASGTVNAINSFGGILALNPSASGKVTVGTDTAYGTVPLQVAGGIAVQSNASGALSLGQYSVGTPNAIINAQNNDGSSPTSLVFEFGGTTPIFKIFPNFIQVPSMKATTGARYVCVDTTGGFFSSATACSGT